MVDLAVIARDLRENHPRLYNLYERLGELRRRARLEEWRRCDLWPTQAQAARLAGVHRGTICRAIQAGRLQTEVIFGRKHVDPVSLLYLQRRLEDGL